MHIKKILTLNYERILIYIKAQKAVFFLPLVISGLVLPFFNILYFEKGVSNESFVEKVTESTLLLIPICSSISIPFLIKDCFESNGKEALFVRNHSKIPLDMVILYLVNSLILMHQYILYESINTLMIYEAIRITIASLFFFSMAFLTIVITNSSITATAIQILYLIINLTLQRSEGYNPLIYYYPTLINGEMLFEQCIPMFIISLLLIVLSIKVQNRKTL